MRRATLSGALLLLLASPAFAVDIVVDETSDAVQSAPTGAGCVTALGGCTLRAALQVAASWPGPDRILLPAGTIQLSIPGIFEDLGLTGDFDLLSDVTIEGMGRGVTTVDGGALDRVFHVPFGGSANVTLRDLRVVNGSVDDDCGAGLCSRSAITLTFERVAFAGNHSHDTLGSGSQSVGGGLSIHGGSAMLRECVFSRNSADRGGALFTNSPLVIEDSAVFDNTARAGSAIASFGSTTIERSAFYGNESTGNVTLAFDSAPATVRNSTFSDNTDSFAVLDMNGATLRLENVTVFANAAPSGVAAAGVATLELLNTVLVTDGLHDECRLQGGALLSSLGHNVDDDGTCAGAGPGDRPSTDPQLGPLANHGGPTSTHLPLAGSVLIDGGDDPGCPAVDQRGEARPFDGDASGGAQCDIGAVELVPEPALGWAASAALLALAAIRRRRI